MNNLIQIPELSISTNLAHVATLRMSLEDFTNTNSFQIESGTDDLDSYQVLACQMADGFCFLLQRYCGQDQLTASLLFQSQLANWKEKYSQILELIPKNVEVTWLNENYFSTP